MTMTRRGFGASVLGLLSAGWGGPMFAGSPPPSAHRLVADLGGRLVRNPAGAVFTVAMFEIARDRATGRVRATAGIRLDWAPGWRTRRVSAEADSREDAYLALRAAACREFAGVVPGFDGAAEAA